jgi:hypothetical protein
MPKRITELTDETAPTRDDEYLAIDSSGGGSRKIQLKALLGTGWAYYDDSTYTSGSPLNSNNAKTQITVDGSGGDSVTSELPIGVSALWNASTNKIIAPVTGDSLRVRLDFVADPATSSDFAEIVFDIGSGSPVEIGRDTVTFAKTGATRFFRTYDLFAGSTFTANGCTVYFDTSVSGDSIDIYNLGIKVERVYSA